MPSGTAEKGADNFGANFATSSFNETVTPPPPIDVISPSTSDVQSRSDTSEQQREILRWRRRPRMGRQKSVPLPTKPVKSPSLSSQLRRRDMLRARSSEKKEKYRLVIAAKRRRIDRSTVEAGSVAEQRTPASSTGMEVYEFHSSDSEHGTGERPSVGKTSLGSAVIGGTPQAATGQGKRRGRPRKSTVAAKLFSDSAAPSSASEPPETVALVEQQPADTDWLFGSSSVKNSLSVENEQTSFESSVDGRMTSAEDEKRVPPLRIVFSSRSSSAEKDCASAGCSSSSPGPQPNAAEVATEPPQAETSKGKSSDGLRLTRSKARLHGVPLARGVGDWSANSARSRHGIRRKVKHGVHQLNASKRQRRSNVSEAVISAEVGLRIGILADDFAPGEGILCSSSSSSTTGSSEPPTNTDLLLSQNGIEAFRTMRSMIEERWFEPPPVPTTTTVPIATAAGGTGSSLECARPPSVKKTYLLKKRDRLAAEDNSSTNEESGCRTASIAGPTSILRTSEFAELLETQRQQRERLRKQHAVQRERLTLFADQQMVRADSRRDSPLSASCRLSVARILRDAEIYNPHQLDQLQRPADVPVAESEESVVARLRRLKTSLIKRQKLEADCMRSNQVLEFETAQRRWQRASVDNKTEDAAVAANDHVPLLSVTEQFCHNL